MLYYDMIVKASGFSGIIVPLMTPFKKDGSKIVVDVVSQDRQIKRLIEAGVHGIFLGSNAGEGRIVDVDNWKISIKSGLQTVVNTKSKISTVVGVLRENLSEAIALAQFAKNNGADALVITPGYTAEDPYITRDKILESTKLPIILYNNPEFQKAGNLPISFFQDSVKHRQIIAVKDTSRNPEYFSELLQLRNADTFHVFQGNTQAGMFDSLKLCDGMVPVEANVYPEALVKLWEHGTNTDLASILKYFKDNQEQNGGILRFIKKLLNNQLHVYETDLMYQD
jgi:dihydrodipicolinate synthase/N-acetylneuraminate lyase